MTLGDGTRYPPREALFATVPVLLEAHRLHAEGATVIEAAQATLARTGYGDLEGYSMTLRGSWAYLGLPTRSRSAAQKRRTRTESDYPKNRPSYRHDVTSQMVLDAYRETGTSSGAARIVRMSQGATYDRLVKLGAIVPKYRKNAGRAPATTS